MLKGLKKAVCVTISSLLLSSMMPACSKETPKKEEPLEKVEILKERKVLKRIVCDYKIENVPPILSGINDPPLSGNPRFKYFDLNEDGEPEIFECSPYAYKENDGDLNPPPSSCIYNYNPNNFTFSDADIPLIKSQCPPYEHLNSESISPLPLIEFGDKSGSGILIFGACINNFIDILNTKTEGYYDVRCEYLNSKEIKEFKWRADVASYLMPDK